MQPAFGVASQRPFELLLGPLFLYYDSPGPPLHWLRCMYLTATVLLPEQDKNR